MSEVAPKKQSSRIIALDLMRGYFLLCIIIDHLSYWPNGLDWLSARGELFVSAAEGFFLISGIVLGIVRGSKLINQPFKVPAWLLVKRGLQLYVTYALLAIFFTVVGWTFFMSNPGLKDGILVVGSSFGELVWKTLTFQYLYGWADYLRLYTIFLFASPLVMWLLRKGKWWIVMAGSIAMWAFSPVIAYPDSLFIQPYKWQLLFFLGMTVGFHWKQLVSLWERIPKVWQRSIIATMVVASVATLAFNVFLAFGGEISDKVYSVVAPLRAYLHDNYFNKEVLPITRLSLALLWFWTSFWLFRRFERQITAKLGWLLLPLGTNSLYVYTVHAFLLFFIHLIVYPGNKDLIVNIILSWGTIALIWTMVRYQILFKIIPR